MPNPKKKHSRSRTLKKRTHKHLGAPARSTCPKCGNFKLPHQVCPQCGSYNGREIFPPST